MPGLIQDIVIDSGLFYTKNTANAIYICSGDPTNYTEATSTLALGNKTFPGGGALTGPTANNGRQVASTVITDGTVTVTGTATRWALVDTANTRLLANGSLTASQSVTAGNQFSLASFIIRIPNQ